MWALGAIISFISSGMHQFNSEHEVRNWDGSYHVLYRDYGYSIELHELTNELLYPDPVDRPSAQDCFDKSKLH